MITHRPVVAPMPPRNVKLVDKTATTATIEWDSPDTNTMIDIYLYSVKQLHVDPSVVSNASVGKTIDTCLVYTLQVESVVLVVRLYF